MSKQTFIITIIAIVIFCGSFIWYKQYIEETRFEQHKQELSKPIVVEPKKKEISEYDNERWFTKYSICSKSRFLRYGVSSKTPKYPKLVNNRNNQIKPLEDTVRSVFKRLPHIKTTNESVLLVLETIIAESAGGKYLDVKTGDLGICQIRVDTARSLFKFLDYKHKDVKRAIMSFYDKKMGLYDNLKFNHKFSIAVCISLYWQKMGGKFYNHITTITDRAIAWKSIYNTKFGKGTVNKYINRVNEYKKYIG